MNNCFKVIGKTKRQTVLTPFVRYSAYQERSLRIYLGFVPTQIRTRQMVRLDGFVCDIF